MEHYDLRPLASRQQEVVAAPTTTTTTTPPSCSPAAVSVPTVGVTSTAALGVQAPAMQGTVSVSPVQPSVPFPFMQQAAAHSGFVGYGRGGRGARMTLSPALSTPGVRMGRGASMLGSPDFLGETVVGHPAGLRLASPPGMSTRLEGPAIRGPGPEIAIPASSGVLTSTAAMSPGWASGDELLAQAPRPPVDTLYDPAFQQVMEGHLAEMSGVVQQIGGDVRGFQEVDARFEQRREARRSAALPASQPLSALPGGSEALLSLTLRQTQAEERRLALEEKRLQDQRALEEQRLQAQREQHALEERRLVLEEQRLQELSAMEERRSQERGDQLAAQERMFQVQQEQFSALSSSSLSSSRSSSSSVGLAKINYHKLGEHERIDQYLTGFESFMQRAGLDDTEAGFRLTTLLTGRALEAVAPYPSAGYEELAGVLREYFKLTSENYRLQFRASKIESSETAKAAWVRTQKLLMNWKQLSPAEDWFHLLALEWLLNNVSQDVKQKVLERKFSKIEAAIDFVDDFVSMKQQAAGHVTSMCNQPSVGSSGGFSRGGSGPRRNSHSSGGSARDSRTQSQSPRRRADSRTPSRSPNSGGRIRCFNCSAEGHLRSNCPKLGRGGGAGKSVHWGSTPSVPRPGSALAVQVPVSRQSPAPAGPTSGSSLSSSSRTSRKMKASSKVAQPQGSG